MRKDEYSISSQLPSNAYVMLPDVFQRGYEPRSNNDYNESRRIRHEPYTVGTLIWVRRPECSWKKFKWYIPGNIKEYVLDQNEVIGYAIDVHEEDGVLDTFGPDSTISKALKNSSPDHVMLRWDKVTPPHPIEESLGPKKARGFEGAMYAHWLRIRALINEMEDLKTAEASQERVYVPIGTCTETNLVARHNAMIADTIETWEQLRKTYDQHRLLVSDVYTIAQKSYEEDIVEKIQGKALFGCGACF